MAEGPRLEVAGNGAFPPPIQNVLAATLYTDVYSSLLERLKSPVPQVTLTESAEKMYVTLDTSTSVVSDDDISSEKYVSPSSVKGF